MTPSSSQPASTAFLSERAWVTGPEIRISVVHKPGGIPNPRRLGSLTVLPIPRDTQIGVWRVKSVIMLQIRRTRKQWLTSTWLEGIAEYGTGKTEDEATTDLISSLGEYRASLEALEERLSESARNELRHLQGLIEPLSGS